MDKKMTLEQVKDVATHALDCMMDYENSAKVADAIDAELKARGKPKAWLVSQCGPTVCSEVFSTRAEADECADAWDYPSVEPLFAAPPAPKIETLIAPIQIILNKWGCIVGATELRAALETALQETP